MKMVRALLLFPLALMVIALMGTPVHATKPVLVTGQALAADQSTTVVKTSGNFLFIIVTSQLTFTGGIQGTGPATASATIDTSTGQLVFSEKVAFTGTVMGSQLGTATFLIEGQGTLGGSSLGYDVLTHGTGGLAGLHGVGTSATAAGQLTTTLSLRVHFDPA
jgi:hypothetical protein